MRHLPFRSSMALSLLALLAACSEQAVPVVAGETQQPGQAAAEPAPALEEGTYALVRSGDDSLLGDCEVTWTIYARKSLRIEWSLEGSRSGHVGGEFVLPASGGSCVYQLRYSQEEVGGADLLDSVGVFAGDEAREALLSVVPTIEEHGAFRFSMGGKTLDTDVALEDLLSMTAAEMEAITGTLATSTSTSSGWVPGSVTRGERVGGAAIASGVEGGEARRYALGEPLYLGHWAELSGGNGSIGTRQVGEELMIRYSTDSQEEREVPLREYEGRAWALKLTLTAAE